MWNIKWWWLKFKHLITHNWDILIRRVDFVYSTCRGVFHWNNSALRWCKYVRFRRFVRINLIEACVSTIFDLFYNNIFQFQWACVRPRLYNISQVSIRVRYVSIDNLFAPFWKMVGSACWEYWFVRCDRHKPQIIFVIMIIVIIIILWASKFCLFIKIIVLFLLALCCWFVRSEWQPFAVDESRIANIFSETIMFLIVDAILWLHQIPLNPR